MSRSSRFLGRLLATAAVPAALLVGPTVGAAHAAGPSVYFVSPGGSDSNSGTSPDQAFASLSRASSVTHVAGDRVLLQRGGTYTGTLTVKGAGTAAQPIIVDSYGAGRRPVLTNGGCLKLQAAYTIVRRVITDGCDWLGVEIAAPHATLSKMRVAHNISGIRITREGPYARVFNNRIVDNNRLAPNTPGTNDDYGAQGLEIFGDYSEIAYNRISGGVAPSQDYGEDGSAVEIFGAQHTTVHHNIAWDNKAFTELGNSRTDYTTYSYNVVRSSLTYSDFLVTRGAGDYWGPTKHTVADHNTVSMTGKGDQAFWCGGVCGPEVLTLTDNVLVAAARIGYATAPSSGPYAGMNIGGSGNIYWGSGVETNMLPGDRKIDPKFISSTSLQVATNSPAVDKSSGTTWARDVLGRSSSLDGNGDGIATPDVGAYEQ